MLLEMTKEIEDRINPEFGEYKDLLANKDYLHIDNCLIKLKEDISNQLSFWRKRFKLSGGGETAERLVKKYELEMLIVERAIQYKI